MAAADDLPPWLSLQRLVEQWRAIAKTGKQYQLGSPQWGAALSAPVYQACADELAAALPAPPEADGPTMCAARGETLLAIAGLVNEYHNDGTTRTAAETLTAIADVLGDPFAAPPDEDLPCPVCGGDMDGAYGACDTCRTAYAFAQPHVVAAPRDEEP